ncbi:SoxR reducing system RseC family protein [Paraglaciecola aquimarina]|uniref:SoxR reducing system RseC family protein n=1 Tax=Paraglaciecola algarum TaxID=3050085 RepID=A0ABS9D0U0_9ALTE|nr:SoxR reducing system RseC family protein [Paraglaciecola sp. G1-23]MCF2946548.1 SoxR reducing system RseC family protein [Paraglaciecola sp. G1-23]
MLEEIGIVSAINKESAKQIIWVETHIKSTCGSCEAQSNCGTGAIAKFLAKRGEKLQFDYQGDVIVGQKIKLGIPEESILKASSLVYIVPLFVLMISAVFAQYFLPHLGLIAEFWIIVFAFISAGLSYLAINHYLKFAKIEDFYPRILSVIPQDTQNIKIKQL